MYKFLITPVFLEAEFEILICDPFLHIFLLMGTYAVLSDALTYAVLSDA